MVLRAVGEGDDGHGDEDETRLENDAPPCPR